MNIHMSKEIHHILFCGKVTSETSNIFSKRNKPIIAFQIIEYQPDVLWHNCCSSFSIDVEVAYRTRSTNDVTGVNNILC